MLQMRYLPDLFYFFDQADFPLRHAVLITATTVSQWCTYFHAKILAPKHPAWGELEKSGHLPTEIRERQVFVAGVVNWLFENSVIEDLFFLRLNDAPLSTHIQSAKFDHPDDTCCWVLDLIEAEFAQVQAAWKANGLPEDLFYPEDAHRCVPFPGTGWKAALLRALGVQKCYTPRQWKAETSQREETL